MRILGLETATEACSAALADGDRIIERYRVAPREHSLLILPMLQSLLDEAGLSLNQIDALAFGCGPGSFTGVRIATGVVQGIALGADLPVVPVSTLAAMAQDVFEEFPEAYAFPAIDARMKEVYWGVFRRSTDGFAEPVGGELVAMAREVPVFGAGAGIGVGSGWGSYPDDLSARVGPALRRTEAARFPRAAAVVRLGVAGYNRGLAVPAEQALPVYLRDKVAKTQAERRAPADAG